MLKLLFLALLASLSLTSGYSQPKLLHAQDSLVSLLEKSPPKSKRRLEILNHLCDIGLSIYDHTHILPCWDEAAEQNSVFDLDEIAAPMIEYYQLTEQYDSVAVWMERCRRTFKGDWLTSNIEYIEMMADVRDPLHYHELAEQMIDAQFHIDPQEKPFKAMRALYTLAAISREYKETNPALDLKPSEEYLDDALQIAQSIPFRLSIRFQRQILLARSDSNIKNAREYFRFVRQFYNEIDIDSRPFYTRCALIQAYKRMIKNGSGLEADELNEFYAHVQDLLSQYPNDAPIDVEFFEPQVQFHYHQASDNKEQALIYCDSLLNMGQQYSLNKLPYYEYKVQALGELGRWEEGYQTAVALIHLRDSLAHNSCITELAELQTQYDVDSYVNEINQRNHQLTLAVVIGSMLLVMAIIAFYYTRMLQRKNSILLIQLDRYTQSIQREKKVKKQRDEAIRKEQLSPEERIEEKKIEEEKIQEEKSKEEDLHEEDELAASKLAEYQEIMDHLNTYLCDEGGSRDQSLNRDLMVEKMGINKNKLTEAVAWAHQTTASEYVTQIRLEDALVVMKEQPEISLNEVSDLVGFGVYSTFYRCFLKKYGISPTEFRKHLSENLKEA